MAHLLLAGAPQALHSAARARVNAVAVRRPCTSCCSSPPCSQAPLPTDTAGSSASSAGPGSESYAGPEAQVQGLQRKLQQLMGALEETHAAHSAACRDRDQWHEGLVAAQSQVRQLELQSQELCQALSAAQAALQAKDALAQQLAGALERQQRADSNDGHAPGSDAASSRSFAVSPWCSRFAT
jgi:TolA-binding protein